MTAGKVCGQSFYFRHYQVEDGLANNTVFSIFRDARGFMWFGTKEGLNRFDGGTFKAFNMTQDNLREAKEFVYSIEEGIHQTLWVGTRKGLYEFNEQKETFSLLRSTQDTEILDIKSDGKGKIWFTSDLQLYCYDEQKHRTHFYDFRAVHAPHIAAISIASDHTVWVCSLNGYLFRYDPSSDNFLCVNNTEKQARPWGVNRIFCTNTGEILIGSISGLTSFDPAKGTYRPLLGLPLQQKPVYVRDILKFAEDTYWIASESGIYSYHLKSGQVINLQKDNSNPYSISDNAVYALCKDTEGGIWCGTYFGGVNYFHSRHSYFKKYFAGSSNSSLSGSAVRELCEDPQGNLWIGTEDAGLNKLNRHTGEVTRFSSPDVVSSTNIHGLLIDGNELWVGTFQRGLDVLDIHTGKRLRHYNADPAVNGLSSNFIITFCKTRAGEILLGTSYGVYRYLRNSKRFAVATEIPQSSYVFSLFEDRNGTVWAGTIGNGLYYFNAGTGQQGNFSYNAHDQHSLSSNSVCGIFEDSDENMWFTTEGGGLCKLNKDGRGFTRFNTDSGLPSNMVYKVLEDSNKHLWISTSRGLVLYDPAQSTWKIYTKAHGLLTDQFNYNSGYRDPDGTLYFGSVKGLISFDPQLIVPDSVPPPVYITSFQVNNEELPINGAALQKAVTFTDTIRLRHHQSSFAIGFAALTYIAPEMTPYAYRLDGLDEQWTYLKTNRKVYFTDLSPSEYTFRVRTTNANGEWLNNEARVLIIISPPFWLSPLAYFVYALIVLALIYIGFRAYNQRLKEKNKRKQALFEQEKEKEIYRAKIEFFTNVAHEIRTPLTLIKGPLETVIDEVGEQPRVKKSLKNIERNTERLISLTDQLLDFRQTENQGFTLSFVKANIPKLVKENFLAFAPSAEQRSLRFNIDLPEKSFHAFIDIEAFHKIMTNLIGNAVKYAAQQVTMRVWAPDETPDSFRIEISNDGQQIPWALREKIFEPFFRIAATGQPGSGIGLSLARALTDLHSGLLELKQENNGLNVFLLTLPVHQKIEFRLSSIQKKSI